MNGFLYRAVVLAGDVMGFVADLLPGTHDDWLERDYEAAVVRVEKMVDPRVVDRLDEGCRDTEWVSHYGLPWRWDDDTWEYCIDGFWSGVPSYYTPTLGPFTEVVVSNEVNQ